MRSRIAVWAVRLLGGFFILLSVPFLLGGQTYIFGGALVGFGAFLIWRVRPSKVHAREH